MNSPRESDYTGLDKESLLDELQDMHKAGHLRPCNDESQATKAHSKPVVLAKATMKINHSRGRSHA